MTPLRRRMTQDLQLRGYSDRTVEAYVRAVAQLAQFYHASPDQLTEEQIRQYLVHLSTVQKVARGTHTIALCGISLTRADLDIIRECPCPVCDRRPRYPDRARGRGLPHVRPR